MIYLALKNYKRALFFFENVCLLHIMLMSYNSAVDVNCCLNAYSSVQLCTVYSIVVSHVDVSREMYVVFVHFGDVAYWA